MRSRRFLKVLDFVANILEQLEISPDKTRVGMVVYSADAQEAFYLNTYSSKQDVVHHVRLLQYMGEETHTSDALRLLVINLCFSYRTPLFRFSFQLFCDNESFVIADQ